MRTTSGPAETSLPHQQAVDMTAPETFTTASKRSLTKGRRPDMTGICAFETFEATSRIDVERTSRVATANVAGATASGLRRPRSRLPTIAALPPTVRRRGRST